jgi:hypothetical protein
MAVSKALPWALLYDVLGERVVVRADDEAAEWPGWLATLLAPFQASWLAGEPDSLIEFRVHRSADGGLWQICQADETISAEDEVALVRELEWRVFAVATRRSPYPLLLHTGAVARDGHALLLPATSGSGKSTLTLALSLQGWLPLSDDVCGVIAHDGELQALPCPRCCHLSNASFLTLVRAGAALERPIPDLDWYFRPLQWGNAAPVRMLILPRYLPGASLALVPVTQAECLAELLSVTFAHASQSHHDHLHTASRLACQAPAYRLIYSDMFEACAAIESLVADRHGAAHRGDQISF